MSMWLMKGKTRRTSQARVPPGTCRRGRPAAAGSRAGASPRDPAGAAAALRS
uniref:Uncharacterized protein n=1 Tax=Oryza brachyantha TaxID=4533 RepID=J3NA23_ORYBR